MSATQARNEPGRGTIAKRVGESSSRKAIAGHGSDQRSARSYRPDIDGLRALAVLPIVGFHLGYQRVSGGYVGVDIFFVISGYLIGGILLSEIRNESYSLARFYVRRFRRIVPALVVTLLLTTLAMWFVAYPRPLIDYGRSLIAATLSVSNLFFWQTAGYFDTAADTKPLLHTWSLAVEEQFYLLFPLILLLIARLGLDWMRRVILALTLGSFVLCVIGTYANPTAAFYLLPTRFWELLLGVVAVETKVRALHSARWREALCVAGAGLVGASIFFYTPSTRFPGMAALMPCAGTAMLLVAGAHGTSFTSRLLSLRPLVFFGLISYSLYLWHWPIIVLLKEWFALAELSHPLRLAAMGASVAMAWLSWRVVERPLRSSRISGETIIWGTTASAVLLIGIGAWLIQAKGVPDRFNAEIAAIAAVLDNPATNEFRSGSCFITSSHSFSQFDRASCLKRNPARPNVLLMGDSHAAHLWSGLSRSFPGVQLQQATASGCRPVLIAAPAEATRCRAMMHFIFRDYLRDGGVKHVILAGNWIPDDRPYLRETLKWLKGRGIKVALVGPSVEYKVSLPKAVARSVRDDDPGFVPKMLRPGLNSLDGAFENLAESHGAIYYSPYRTLCHAGSCKSRGADGRPLQYDRAHLTAAGSLLVAKRFPMADLLSQRTGSPPGLTTTGQLRSN